MKVCTLFGTDVRVSPYLLLVCFVGTVLGVGRDMVVAFACAAMHELFHIAVTLMLGIHIESIEMTPFGGVAHIRDKRMTGIREAAVAAAGPLFNAAAFFALMYFASEYPSDAVVVAIKVNLMMLIFNLIPAFPLDGGRILRALLSYPLGRPRATRIAVLLGMILGFSITIGGVLLAIRDGKINIPIIFIGATILAVAGKEKSDNMFYAAIRMKKKSARIKKAALPERSITAGREVLLSEICRELRRDDVLYIRIVDDRMKTIGYMDENSVLERILDGKGDSTLGEALLFG